MISPDPNALKPITRISRDVAGQEVAETKAFNPVV